MMELRIFAALIVLVVSTLVGLCSGEITCHPIDQCSCKMSDTGKIVSLWDIDNPNTPRFQNQQQMYKEYYFDYSPCTPFSEGSGDGACIDELCCQHDKDLTLVDSAGKANLYSIDYHEDTKTLFFVYRGYQKSDYKRTTNISLECKETADEPSMTAPEETTPDTQSSIYTFTLTTKCACPGFCHLKEDSPSRGISTGSILVILFFVFVIVYFVGGFLLLKFYKKKEGTEAIPQYEFWKDFPAKVKDGVVFTVDRIKGKKGEYQQI